MRRRGTAAICAGRKGSSVGGSSGITLVFPAIPSATSPLRKICDGPIAPSIQRSVARGRRFLIGRNAGDVAVEGQRPVHRRRLMPRGLRAGANAPEGVVAPYTG